MNRVFTYALLPIGALEIEEKNDDIKENYNIDSFYLYLVLMSYKLSDKHIFKDILKYLNYKDKISFPFELNYTNLYSKGFCFSVESYFDKNYYTDCLNGICKYLIDKDTVLEYKKLINFLFKQGAKDLFYSNLILASKNNNFSLFEALFTSLIFIVSDVKFLLECLYITKNKDIKDYITHRLLILGFEEMIDLTK